MPQYISKFLSNGFDTMESIYGMKDEDLKNMGIEKKDHRKAILKHVPKIFS